VGAVQGSDSLALNGQETAYSPLLGRSKADIARYIAFIAEPLMSALLNCFLYRRIYDAR
jgi:hypothetical protein